MYVDRDFFGFMLFKKLFIMCHLSTDANSECTQYSSGQSVVNSYLCISHDN